MRCILAYISIHKLLPTTKAPGTQSAAGTWVKWVCNHPVVFPNSTDFLEAVKTAFRQLSTVDFDGCYEMAVDARVSDLERTKIIVEEIWMVSGYRWT